MKKWTFVILVAALLAVAPAYAQGPNVYTSIVVSDVISGAPIIGSTFTTTVGVSVTNNSTPEVGIMGIELWIPFDETVVTVQDQDGNLANGIQVQITPGFFGGSLVVGANEVLDSAIAPPECGGQACVHLAVSQTGAEPVAQNSGQLAVITWAGIAAGPASISIAPDSILADRDGQSIPINSLTVPSINIVAAGNIVGFVHRQGSLTGYADVEVTALSTVAGVDTSTFTAGDGAFSLAVPLGGTYYVRAVYNGYLDAQKMDVYVAGAVVNVGTTVMRGGEINRDGCINILDIVSIISKFGTSGLPSTSSQDINDDGTVNILDLTISAGNFGLCGPTTW